MSSCLMFGKCNRGWSDAYLPTPLVIEKICAEAITRANKIIYERLTADLTQTH